MLFVVHLHLFSGGGPQGAATYGSYEDSTISSPIVSSKQNLTYKRNLEIHPSGNICFRKSRAFL